MRARVVIPVGVLTVSLGWLAVFAMTVAAPGAPVRVPPAIAEPETPAPAAPPEQPGEVGVKPQPEPDDIKAPAPADDPPWRNGISLRLNRPKSGNGDWPVGVIGGPAPASLEEIPADTAKPPKSKPRQRR